MSKASDSSAKAAIAVTPAISMRMARWFMAYRFLQSSLLMPNQPDFSCTYGAW